MQFHFRPRLVDSLKGYSRRHFFADFSAGLTVAVVALPLAMAFAIASGVKPEAGLFTAIIAGFIISALGGSRFQIGGPAGAFIVVVYGIIERYGLANLLISTILAGILLFAMGFFKTGNLIRYIPIAVVIGFTNGIAILIGVSQIQPFFGLDTGKLPADFFDQIAEFWGVRSTADWPTFLVSAFSLAMLFLWPRLMRPRSTGSAAANAWRGRMASVPGPIIVLVLGTLIVSLAGLQVATIGSKFGGIPQSLPSFALPDFSWKLVKQLFPPTLTIALLCAIESLLCARVSDSVTGDRHDPNQELMAQGIANFVAPFFGGIPATGTIARTITNIRSGATSPVAGMVHAVAVLAVLLFAAPLASDIPLATLAAILVFVAFNMGDWHEFSELFHFSLQYRIILIATFLLTVIFDLTVAVEAGIILSCMFFIYRISSLTRLETVRIDPPSSEIAAYGVFGSLFFGSVSKIESLSEQKLVLPKIMILELHQMINLDTTGLDALERLHRNLGKNGSRLILCALNKQPESLVRRSGFLASLGPENITTDLAAAVALAHSHLRSHLTTR